MSTHSFIGMTEDGKNVRYVYCQLDGYLSYNGVMLDMFYRDKSKVEKLINLGFIDSLKYKECLPKVFYDFQTLHVNNLLIIQLCLWESWQTDHQSF